MQGGTGLTPQGGLGLGLTPLTMGMGMGIGGTGGMVHGLAGMSPAEQEEERRRRLEVIRDLVGTRAAGWVCQEGVERAARKVGLECLWEEAMGVGEKRILSIAGSGVLVEVDFQGDAVSEVGLSFPASKEGDDGVGRWAKKGGKVLEKDLVGNEMDACVSLAGFIGNLEKLAKMDQLGGEQVSCFDAVDGIFGSLQRIYEWEVNQAKEEGRSNQEDEVMCNHSGRPQMHDEQRIGLSLQYWKDRRLVSHHDTTFGAMDHDNDGPSEERIDDGKTRRWSILIECQACSATLYDSIRLSDLWVSKDVERPSNQELDATHISVDRIDWLNVKDLGLSEGKPPDVRFVARFEPPVIVPLQLAMQIQESVNSPMDQSTVLPTPYEALLFADIDTQVPLLTSPRTFEQRLTTGGSHKLQNYTFTLFNQSQDFAQSTAEIPFKHPMQIVSLLPTLRQWVLVGNLLRRSFTPNPLEEPSPEVETTQKLSKDGKTTATPPVFQTLEEELADFLSSPSDTTTTTRNHSSSSAYTKNNNGINISSSDNNKNPSSSSLSPLAVEISFTTSPSPRFTVHFQNPKYGGKLASVGFSIGLNGTFEAVEVDDGRPPPIPPADGIEGMAGSSAAEEEEMRISGLVRLREKVKRVLEIGESIGVLVGWLCR